MYKTESFTHRRVFTTTNASSRQSLAWFPSHRQNGNWASWCMRKQRYYGRDAHGLTVPFPSPKPPENQGIDKTWWDLTGLWNRAGDPFPGPDSVLAAAVLHWCLVVLHWCCRHGGCSWGSSQLAWAPLLPLLFPPFSFFSEWHLACRRCLSAPNQKRRGSEEGERGCALGWFYDAAPFLIVCFMPRNGCCGF